MKARRQGDISLPKEVRERLRAFCALYGVSMSSVVEAQVKSFLDSQPENLLAEAPGAQKGQVTS